MVGENRYFEDAAHELVEEARGRKAVCRALARESARTYADLLDDLFFYSTTYSSIIGNALGQQGGALEKDSKRRRTHGRSLEVGHRFL